MDGGFYREARATERAILRDLNNTMTAEERRAFADGVVGRTRALGREARRPEGGT
jgi:hypothetical protein